MTGTTRLVSRTFRLHPSTDVNLSRIADAWNEKFIPGTWHSHQTKTDVIRELVKREILELDKQKEVPEIAPSVENKKKKPAAKKSATKVKGGKK